MEPWTSNKCTLVPATNASAQHRSQSRRAQMCCQDPNQTWRPAPNRAVSSAPVSAPRPHFSRKTMEERANGAKCEGR
eukprot:1925311-Alexandrium_andersonii.AAC.1